MTTPATNGWRNDLCSSCQSLVDHFYLERASAFQEPYQVASNFLALERSARNGCHFCGILLVGIWNDIRPSPRILRLGTSPITVIMKSVHQQWCIILAQVPLLENETLPSIMSVYTGNMRPEDAFEPKTLQDPSLLQYTINRNLRVKSYSREGILTVEDDGASLADLDMQHEEPTQAPQDLGENEQKLTHGYDKSEIYGHEDTEASSSPRICDLTTAQGLDRMTTLVKEWLAACQSDHLTCATHQDRVKGLPQLPTRVLDVGTLTEPSLHLHVTKKGQRAQYITLSYCWGRDVPEVKTTTATVDEMQKQVPFSPLPRAVQDAILFARRLGVRYLRVDALCIIQDENRDPADASSTTDWELEAARFSWYYQNSLCTLAATGSHDSSEGLFLPSNDLMYPAFVSTRSVAGSDEVHHTWIPHVRATSELITGAPLFRREWAVQERLMSPRIVHFTQRYVIWECAELLASERPPGQDPPLENQQVDSLGILRACLMEEDMDTITAEWILFCHAYGNKDFTRRTDRLPALSGLARRIQDHTGSKFYAGLWEGQITEGLLWFIAISEKAPGLGRGPMKPSWSWASSRGLLKFWGPRIYIWPGFRFTLDTDLHVIHVEVQHSGRSTDGPVIGGLITIDGVVAILNMEKLLYSRASPEENFWVMEGDNDLTGVFWDRHAADSQVLRSHACLRVGVFGSTSEADFHSVGALVLASTTDQQHGSTEYRRVGFGIFRRQVWEENVVGKRVINLV